MSYKFELPENCYNRKWTNGSKKLPFIVDKKLKTWANTFISGHWFFFQDNRGVPSIYFEEQIDAVLFKLTWK